MAKSIRAKAKMAARKKKRESGSYHALDAARVARISAKLLGKEPKAAGDDEDMQGEHVDEAEAEGEDAKMDAEEQPKKISTSAPRDSRREKWRESKGMTPRPIKKGTNRQGLTNGRRKAGRPKRRR